MTDNEIIKALGCCQHRSDVIICSSNCPLFEWCEDEDNDDNVCNLALDLINRLQAEISVKNKLLDIAEEKFKHIKAEAYKEFAERLKERKYLDDGWSHGEHPYVVEESDIDDVYEELVGEDNE